MARAYRPLTRLLAEQSVRITPVDRTTTPLDRRARSAPTRPRYGTPITIAAQLNFGEKRVRGASDARAGSPQKTTAVMFILARVAAAASYVPRRDDKVEPLDGDLAGLVFWVDQDMPTAPNVARHEMIKARVTSREHRPDAS